MRKPLVAVVIAALGVLTLTGASLGTDAGNGSHGHSRTLTFDVQFSGFFLLDFGTDGAREVTDINAPELTPSRGDQIVFEAPLPRRGARAGGGGGPCPVPGVALPATPPITLSCQATYQLPDG